MRAQNINSNPKESYNSGINLSFHSKVRSQQRGISKDLLFLALDYSMAIFKQGLIFFAVIDKLIPDNIDHHVREKLNKLVVVVSLESNEIVTCYRTNNGIHHINRKSKRLAS